MARGTPAIGKRHQKTHTFCKRCGKQAYHIQKKKCATCAYPASRTRMYSGWGLKVARRRGEGTGRLRYLKTVPRRAKNGFRTQNGLKAKQQ
ncbi:60S ribosomal protein L37 [Paramecium bursaria]